jgi:uncharacterized protein YqcC (DUF446 family)
MIGFPRVPGSPRPSWRRIARIAAGCGVVCFVLLAPLLHFAARVPWADALRVAVYAGLGTTALLAVMALLINGTDALFDVISGRARARRRVPVARRAAALKELSATLDAIEAELRRIGWWVPDPPELRERYRRGELRSYLDAPSFELWLQCVFLPNARDAVANDAMPASSSVGVMAMRQYDYHSFVPEAQPLLALLHRFDEQANRYVGHDPLGP